MEPHACIDPENLLDVIRQIVAVRPTVHEKEHLAAVMRHYQGKVNPKVVINEIRAASARLLPKQRAGHTADCAMEGCESIPSCQSEPKAVLTLRKKLGVAMQALEEIRSDWRPGRRPTACDPFTVANKALKDIGQ